MRRLLAAVLAACGLISGAVAQSYPSKPVTIVVALPAGGAVDALARVLAEHMRVTLGQPVIIENMAGAGGTLSMARIVRAEPDGYTIGMGTLSQYVVAAAVYHVQFDVLKDLEPVALLPSVPYWMIGRKNLPANNLQEVVALLKASPNKYSASSVGTASLARFCGMFFQKQTGTNFQFVPYRGGAPALQDLVAGQIDFGCDLAANSLAAYRNDAGYSHDRRGRRAQRLCQHLARPLDPEGNAGSHRCESQRRRQRRHDRSGHAETHSRSRHGASRSRAADACGLRCLS